MGIPVEGISVVVRNETLDRIYPGGVTGFHDDRPNETCITDGVLTRVSFMNPVDVALFLVSLERFGLVHKKRGKAIDIAVVDRFGGPTLPCVWLQFVSEEGEATVVGLPVRRKRAELASSDF